MKFGSLISTVRAVVVMALASGLSLSMPAAAADPIRVSGEASPVLVKDSQAMDLRLAAFPKAAVAQLQFPAISEQRLQRVREYNSSPGAKLLQLGVDRSVADETQLKALPTLNWVQLKQGGQVARFSVASPGAAALRLGLNVLGLPEGAELRFVGEGQSRSVVDPVSTSEVKNAIRAQPVYWTPVTEGESQAVEIYLPAALDSAQVRLSVVSLAHMLASPYGSLRGLKIGESEACEIDANCVSNPSQAYNNAKNAVARMSFQDAGSSFLCTGTLMNDTVAGSFIPYFFSANHCISSQATASTLVTFWFMESTSCGSGVASARVQVSGGAALLYNNAALDALLLRLNNSAPSGSVYAGWDSSVVSAGSNFTVIHHPAGDVKKVSLGQVRGLGTYNGAGSFVNVAYTSATTEGGSSGAGLLIFSNGEYYVRGGLYGGAASCSNTGNINNPANSDSYSRFDLAFAGLQPFLAPSGQSQPQLTVVNAGTGSGTVTSNPAGISCGSSCSASFNSGTSVVLTAAAAAGSTFTSWSGCDSSNGNTCTVVLNASRSVTSTFTASGGGGSALQNGVPVSGIAGAEGSNFNYTIAIPAGAQNLVIRTAGGSGDPDLYVRYGSPPTTSTYDCRSFAIGPTEQCSFVTPSAGTYYVLINGFSAFSGLTLTATWTVPAGGGVDEPSYTQFLLPIPNPAFANCPAGYFTATVEDGPGAGLSPGTFGLALELRPPGTLLLDGGLNFGGLVDGSQVMFAGVNFLNPANEPQRLTLNVLGSAASSQSSSLPVRIKVIRQPAVNVNETVLDVTTTLTMAQAYIRSIDLSPSYYVVTIGPEGAASVPGGAADGQVYVALGTQFVNRAGGGFSSGVVIGGYHATHPFGGVSAFAAICLGTQHRSDARVLSAPTYGAGGARDLRLRLFDFQQREVISVPQ